MKKRIASLLLIALLLIQFGTNVLVRLVYIIF